MKSEPSSEKEFVIPDSLLEGSGFVGLPLDPETLVFSTNEGSRTWLGLASESLCSDPHSGGGGLRTCISDRL